MHKMVLLCAVGALTPAPTFAEGGRWSVKVMLNVANCTQHSVQIKALNDLNGSCDVIVRMSEEDRKVGRQVLNTLGYTENIRAKVEYVSPTELARDLLSGGRSRIVVRAPKGLWCTFPLDSLPWRVDWLNTVSLLRATRTSSSIPEVDQLSSYLLNAPFATGVALMDKIFNMLWVYTDSAGVLHARKRALDDAFLKDAFQKIDNQLWPGDPNRKMLGLDLLSWSMSGLVVSTDPGIDYGIAVSMVFDNSEQEVAGDSTLPATMILRMKGVNIEDCFAGPARDSANSDYSAYFAGNQSVVSQHEFVCALIKFQNVSGPEHLFDRYGLNAGVLRRTGFCSADLPKELWENGFQYDYINGLCAGSYYLFGSYPMLIDHTTGAVHHLGAILGLPKSGLQAGSSSFTASSFQYAFGIASILYWKDDRLFWARIDLLSDRQLDTLVLYRGKAGPEVNVLIDVNTAMSFHKTTRRCLVHARR